MCWARGERGGSAAWRAGEKQPGRSRCGAPSPGVAVSHPRGGGSRRRCHPGAPRLPLGPRAGLGARGRREAPGTRGGCGAAASSAHGTPDRSLEARRREKRGTRGGRGAESQAHPRRRVPWPAESMFGRRRRPGQYRAPGSERNAAGRARRETLAAYTGATGSPTATAALRHQQRAGPLPLLYVPAPRGRPATA